METERHHTQVKSLERLDDLRRAIESLPPDATVYNTLNLQTFFLKRPVFLEMFSGQEVDIDERGTMRITHGNVMFASSAEVVPPKTVRI
jgi:hypothetical protein